MKLIEHLTDFPSPYELEIDSKEELEIIKEIYEPINEIYPCIEYCRVELLEGD